MQRAHTLSVGMHIAVMTVIVDGVDIPAVVIITILDMMSAVGIFINQLVLTH